MQDAEARAASSSTDAARPALRVSVVVPHFDDPAGLRICLAALERQTLPREAFEIIVADNDSSQGEARVVEVIAGRARLTVVRERGAGAARNGGVDLARGEMLAFTDADCRPEPDWLVEGLRALADFDVVGGRMTVLVQDRQAMTPEEAFESLFAFDNESYVNNKGFSVSANLFCSRDTFRRVGGFAPAGVSEDVEWCRRATGAGLTIGYADRAGVGHPARRTWSDLQKKWRRLNLEALGLMRKRRWGRLMWLLRTIALPLSVVAHTPRALFRKADLTWPQRIAALRVLCRLRLWRLADSLRLLTVTD